MPGQEKTDSTTTLPAMRNPNTTPMSVTTGIMQFRSASPYTMVRRGSPAAHAALM